MVEPHVVQAVEQALRHAGVDEPVVPGAVDVVIDGWRAGYEAGRRTRDERLRELVDRAFDARGTGRFADEVCALVRDALAGYPEPA